MSRVALVVGATGLVGGHVVDRLLADARWSRVVVLARRDLGKSSEKLSTRIVDFEALADDPGSALAKASLAGIERLDDVFVCLGTTIKVAGSQERFRRVDHDYAVAAARLGRDAGARTVAFVSSVGASESSSAFYLRVKGETERDVRALGFDATVIARPSFLVGDRTDQRPGEQAGILFARAAAPLMAFGLRKYRPVEARAVAAAMIEAAAAGEPGVRVLGFDELTARG